MCVFFFLRDSERDKLEVWVIILDYFVLGFKGVKELTKNCMEYRELFFLFGT